MLCKRWKTAGQCDKGSRCWFAHGTHELRPRTGFGPPPASTPSSSRGPRTTVQGGGASSGAAGIHQGGQRENSGLSSSPGIVALENFLMHNSSSNPTLGQVRMHALRCHADQNILFTGLFHRSENLLQCSCYKDNSSIPHLSLFPCVHAHMMSALP